MLGSLQVKGSEEKPTKVIFCTTRKGTRSTWCTMYNCTWIYEKRLGLRLQLKKVAKNLRRQKNLQSFIELHKQTFLLRTPNPKNRANNLQ